MYLLNVLIISWHGANAIFPCDILAVKTRKKKCQLTNVTKIIHQFICFYRDMSLLTQFSRNLKMGNQYKILTNKSWCIKFCFTYFHVQNNRANVLVDVSLMDIENVYVYLNNALIAIWYVRLQYFPIFKLIYYNI